MPGGCGGGWGGGKRRLSWVRFPVTMAGDPGFGLRMEPPTLSSWKPDAVRRPIAVLMSGGVDSSVAAAILREAGDDAAGFTMKVPGAGADPAKSCCGPDAALVCRRLGIPHYFLDASIAFERLVAGPFRCAYAAGRTPSPCVDCNAFLKFRAAWDAIESAFGPVRMATGHYARIVEDAEGRPALARASDLSRDQSYFLYGVPPERLDRIVFPVGGMRKADVRARAAALGLSPAGKPDSMEICFAGEGDYRRTLGPDEAGRLGPILDRAGRVVGTHRGIGLYTVGQRKGLGAPDLARRYVVEIRPAENAIVVASREEAFERNVRAGPVRALRPSSLVPGARLLGRIRSPSEPSPCEVVSASPGEIVVRFGEPQFAPAPGQHLVLYDPDGLVAGGGSIFATGGVPSESGGGEAKPCRVFSQ